MEIKRRRIVEISNTERVNNLANFIKNTPETIEFLSFKEKIGLTSILYLIY
jgi:hypothetical protein